MRLGLMAALLLSFTLAVADSDKAGLKRQSLQQASELDSPVVLALPGHKVNQALVDAFMALPSQRNATDRAVATQRVAELYLLSQEAHRQGLTGQREHIAGLAMAELNYLSTALLQSMLADVDVSESALRALHQSNLEAAGGFEYRLSWMVFEQREQATAIVEEVNDLESFGLAARKHSQDQETAEFGGELGWRKRTELAAPLHDVLDQLSPGEIYPEPIALPQGWGLLMLRDRRDLAPPDFDAIRPALISQARREAVTELVNRLRDQAGLPPRD